MGGEVWFDPLCRAARGNGDTGSASAGSDTSLPGQSRQKWKGERRGVLLSTAYPSLSIVVALEAIGTPLVTVEAAGEAESVLYVLLECFLRRLECCLRRLDFQRDRVAVCVDKRSPA